MKLLIKSDKRMATYREKGYDIAIIVLWDPESKPQKQKTKSKITVDGEECEIDTINVTNWLQPFREDVADANMSLKT